MVKVVFILQHWEEEMEELIQVLSLERLRDDEYRSQLQISLVVWSKAWVCGRLLAGIAGSNPAGVYESL
jgi:hypothetical protein